MANSRLFGYFDNAVQTTPAYDPGVNVACLYCGKQLCSPMKTISLMVPGDGKSYFYRLHKECFETMTPEEVCDYESSLIDKICEERDKK